MLTELHEVAAGRVEEDSIRISFRKVFAGRKINFVQDYVETVDLAQKMVLGRNGTYPYDYLVMAAGSQPTYLCIPGAEEYSWRSGPMKTRCGFGNTFSTVSAGRRWKLTRR